MTFCFGSPPIRYNEFRDTRFAQASIGAIVSTFPGCSSNSRDSLKFPVPLLGNAGGSASKLLSDADFAAGVPLQSPEFPVKFAVSRESSLHETVSSAIKSLFSSQLRVGLELWLVLRAFRL